MIDESLDTKQMKQPSQDYEFLSKPACQRLLIMIGGVLVNFLLALFIYSIVLYTWGDDLPTANVKYGIAYDSLAIKAGLRNGDKILTINHKKVENFGHITSKIIMNNVPTTQIERNGEELNVQISKEIQSLLIKNQNIVFVTPRYPFIIAEMEKSPVAMKAGILPKDKIVRINGEKIKYYDELRTEILKFRENTIRAKLLRGNDTVNASLVVPDTGLLGIKANLDDFKTKKISYSFLFTFPAGVKKGIYTLTNYLKSLKLFFEPENKAYEALGGFISIGKIFSGIWDWGVFWNLTAFLSIMLAVMNILPIPALDGGYVLFLFVEVITGRKPSENLLTYAQVFGMALLLGLLLFANGNDIYKYFIKYY